MCRVRLEPEHHRYQRRRDHPQIHPPRQPRRQDPRQHLQSPRRRGRRRNHFGLRSRVRAPARGREAHHNPEDTPADRCRGLSNRLACGSGRPRWQCGRPRKGREGVQAGPDQHRPNDVVEQSSRAGQGLLCEPGRGRSTEAEGVDGPGAHPDHQEGRRKVDGLVPRRRVHSGQVDRNQLAQADRERQDLDCQHL